MRLVDNMLIIKGIQHSVLPKLLIDVSVSLRIFRSYLRPTIVTTVGRKRSPRDGTWVSITLRYFDHLSRNSIKTPRNNIH